MLSNILGLGWCISELLARNQGLANILFLDKVQPKMILILSEIDFGCKACKVADFCLARASANGPTRVHHSCIQV